MKVLIVSDCPDSLICGVTRKQNELIKELRKNHVAILINPDDYFALDIPYWHNVKAVLPNPISYYRLTRMIEQYDPNMIHIMTEGPLGLMTSIHCTLKGRPYTTMRCTRFELYFPHFEKLVSVYLDTFHSFSKVCISPSPTLSLMNPHKNSIGILNGCNLQDFSHKGPYHYDIHKLPKPIFLYVGRISKEKNIISLLEISTSLPGSVVIVGDGPLKNIYAKKYTNVHFMGWLQGKELSAAYRTCDVLVFPSKTDTFGQVMVEAQVSGLPIAAYPVVGPVDVVDHMKTGYLDHNLLTSCMKAYELTKSQRCQERCIKHASSFSWETMCNKFLDCQVYHIKSKRPHIYRYIFASFISILYFYYTL